MKLSELVNTEHVKDEWAKGKCYLLKGRSVYQLNWSGAQKRMTAIKLYTKPQGGVPLVNPGRMIMSGDGSWVNKIIGQTLLTETNYEL